MNPELLICITNNGNGDFNADRDKSGNLPHGICMSWHNFSTEMHTGSLAFR